MATLGYSGGMIAKAQHQIARTLGTKDGVAAVRDILGGSPELTRVDAARKVCGLFDFRDRRGRLQVSTCLTALNRLSASGRIELPATGSPGGWKRHPRGTGEAPPAPATVPECAEHVSGLELRLVDGDADMQLWNELMLREHPQGDRIITGRQLRYLIWSDHGLLGALGVSSGALHLEDRDKWIGWDWPTRQRYLERVICMSRFLIRPCVQCRNLASKVLGLFARRVAPDFENIYGYRPWLIESFVDTSRHPGTCYKAANWTLIGRTKGRGRNDRAGSFAEKPKDIYVYCLAPRFRYMMGLPSDAGAVALAPGDGLDSGQWAEKEFGDAPLGDRRLSSRLVAVAECMSRDPEERFLKCASGRSAEMQGYYRFIEHPDRAAVNMESILEPHRQRTIKRMRNEKRILCPQDTTVLRFHNLPNCKGLGPTGANRKGDKQGKGLRLHSTLAVTPDGLPLGVLNGQCVSREFYAEQSREQRRKLPFGQKEGYRWLASVKACEEIAEELPDTRLVSVMDREGDIFELFDHWHKNRKVDLLVRVARNRKSDVAESLFDEIKAEESAGTVRIDLPDRRNRKRQRVTPYANLEMRFKAINMQVPKHKKSSGAVPVPLWMVYACEPHPPPNTKPIKWFLFSTEEIDSLDRATQAIREYARRWRIEEWHKVLKSGCKDEDIIAEDAEAIRRTTAINMVIAWRVMLMTLLGREQPELPPQILFSDVELQVLSRFAEIEGYDGPETLNAAVILTARLGGYMARKSDYPPGTTVLWRGAVELASMARGAALFINYDSG